MEVRDVQFKTYGRCWSYIAVLAWMVLSLIKEQYHSGYQYAILFGAKNSHLPKRHIKARPPAQTPSLAALAAVC